MMISKEREQQLESSLYSSCDQSTYSTYRTTQGRGQGQKDREDGERR